MHILYMIYTYFPSTFLILSYNFLYVVKRFGRKKDVDFKGIFSPIVKMLSIRFISYLATPLKFRTKATLYETTFLYSDLE